GVGMTVGNIGAGRLADRSIYGTIFLGLLGMALTLAVLALVAHQATAGMVMLFIVAVASQLLGPSLQLFLMDASPDAPSLAAALLAAGSGLLAPAWTGVVLALLGLGIASCSYLTHRRQQARAEVAAQAATEVPVAC